MRLILIRHGDAYAGFDGVVSGPRGCKGLTDLGRSQAAALRSHLAVNGRVRADVLLSSTLPRAVETAQIIAPALGIRRFAQRDDLCEILTGDADGLPWDEYATRYGSFNMEAEPERVFAPGGESWVRFHERVRKLLDDLAAEFVGRTVVAVCHAGVIVASIRLLLAVPHPGTGARLQPSNTGLTEWKREETRRRWILHSFNEQDHLLGLERRSFAAGSTGDDIGEGSATPRDDPEFSVESARKAAGQDRLRDWVARFLASPGSDNPVLAELLPAEFAWWAGPYELPLDMLNRLAGPPGDPVLCPVDEDYWDERVDDMDKLAERGWDPPPVIASYRDDRLVLEDGNHRAEGVRRAGRRVVWGVVGFEEREVRDRFSAQWERIGSIGPGSRRPLDM